jgi:hypothetical protein
MAMNSTTKTLGILLIGIILGGALFYSWSRYTTLQTENMALKEQLASPSPKAMGQATPAATAKPVASATPVATATPESSPATAATGTISGSLGYPAGGIPPLVVYAFKQGDFKTFHKLTTKTNQTTFTLENIPTGTYLLVAYPQDSGELVGGYTKAVACGLSVDCKDHNLLPVVVEAGKTVANVEIKDWYAPAGTFPAKPQ